MAMETISTILSVASYLSSQFQSLSLSKKVSLKRNGVNESYLVTLKPARLTQALAKR